MAGTKGRSGRRPIVPPAGLVLPPLGESELEIARYLAAIAERFPDAGAALLVRHLRQPEQRGRVAVERAADWLARLAA